MEKKHQQIMEQQSDNNIADKETTLPIIINNIDDLKHYSIQELLSIPSSNIEGMLIDQLSSLIKSTNLRHQIPLVNIPIDKVIIQLFYKPNDNEVIYIKTISKKEMIYFPKRNLWLDEFTLDKTNYNDCIIEYKFLYFKMQFKYELFKGKRSLDTKEIKYKIVEKYKTDTYIDADIISIPQENEIMEYYKKEKALIVKCKLVQFFH